MTDWLGKPYYSLDAYLKKNVREKVVQDSRSTDGSDVSEPGRRPAVTGACIFLQCGRLR